MTLSLLNVSLCLSLCLCLSLGSIRLGLEISPVISQSYSSNEARLCAAGIGRSLHRLWWAIIRLGRHGVDMAL